MYASGEYRGGSSSFSRLWGSFAELAYSWLLSFLSQCSVSQFSGSVMSNSVTQWTAACQASLSITSSRSLFKLMSIESVMPSNHLVLYCLLLLLSIFPSIGVFSIEPKYWSFSVSISPSNEYLELCLRPSQNKSYPSDPH